MPVPKDGDNDRRGNGGKLWRLVGFVVTVCVGGILIPDVREWLGLPNRPQPVIVVPSPGPDPPRVHVQPPPPPPVQSPETKWIGRDPEPFLRGALSVAFLGFDPGSSQPVLGIIVRESAGPIQLSPKFRGQPMFFDRYRFDVANLEPGGRRAQVSVAYNDRR